MRWRNTAPSGWPAPALLSSPIQGTAKPPQRASTPEIWGLLEFQGGPQYGHPFTGGGIRFNPPLTCPQFCGQVDPQSFLTAGPEGERFVHPLPEGVESVSTPPWPVARRKD